MDAFGTTQKWISTTFAVLVCLGASGEADAQFTQSDLTGTWHTTARRDNPAPGGNAAGIKFGTVVLDAAGNVTGGSETDHTGTTVPHTGGSIAVSPSGAVSGSITNAVATDAFAGHQLDPSGSIILGADTDPNGQVAIETAVKAGGSFSVADLEGAWWMVSHWDLPAPSFNNAGWDDIYIELDSLGIVTFSSSAASTGVGPPLLGIQFTIDGDGVVSIPAFPTTKFKMTPNKDVMLGVTVDGDGYVLGSALVRFGGGFVIGDIEGLWHFYQFYSGAFADTANWTMGQFLLDATGSVQGGTYEFPGFSDTVDGGSFSLTTGGAAVGSLSLTGGGNVSLIDIQVNQAAEFGMGVDSLGTHRIMTLMVLPEPGGPAPLVMGLLLLVVLRTRRRARPGLGSPSQAVSRPGASWSR